MAGLRSKNPSGLNWNPIIAAGITGQSSMRGHMVVGKNVPKRELGILHLPISLGPERKPVSGGVLIGIFACCIALLRAVRCDPKMIGDESCPPHHCGIGLHHGCAVFPWNQAISHRPPQPILLARVDHAPETRGGRIRLPLRFLLCRQQRLLGDKSIAVRIFRASGNAQRVHLVYGIVISVHGRDQPSRKDVLVKWRIQLRSYFHAIFRNLTGASDVVFMIPVSLISHWIDPSW